MAPVSQTEQRVDTDGAGSVMLVPVQDCVLERVDVEYPGNVIGASRHVTSAQWPARLNRQLRLC
jgi:hypothetical protein